MKELVDELTGESILFDTISKDEYMAMYRVIGAAMKVHELLGKGLEEAVYQEAMEIEMNRRNMVHEPQKQIPCYYDGILMKKHYQADIFYEDVIVELKAVEELISDHRAQLFNYMRLSQVKRGLLINFGGDHLYAERYVFQRHYNDFALLTEQNLKYYVQ